MGTYFSSENVLRRFFFLVGKTKDTFCDAVLAATDLEFALYQELRGNAYERIVFYSKTQKLYCYDQTSYDLVLNPAAAPRKKKKQKLLINGPLSSHLLREAPNETPVSAQQGVFHFSKMTDLDAFKRIDHCMCDSRHKTAIVFTNAEDFILSFGEVRTDRGAEDVRSVIYEDMNKYQGLDYKNNNILLFVFPERGLAETMEIYKDCQARSWKNFMGPLLVDKTANIIEIGAPEAGEIRNALNLMRIQHGLKLDLTAFSAMIDMLGKHICANQIKLTYLLNYLLGIANDGKTLSLEMCKEFCHLNDQPTAMERLDAMIGMERVKSRLRTLAAVAEKKTCHPQP